MNQDHVRVNPRNMEFVCAHCGQIEAIQPGLTSGLQEQIDAFHGKHDACTVPVFKPGDRVTFCGEEATVVQNFGRDGTVDLGGGQKCHWYWSFQGERVMPFTTSNAPVMPELADAVNQFKPGGLERVIEGFEKIGKEMRGEA